MNISPSSEAIVSVASWGQVVQAQGMRCMPLLFVVFATERGETCVSGGSNRVSIFVYTL